MLDPLRKKSRVLSRLLGRGRAQSRPRFAFPNRESEVAPGACAPSPQDGLGRDSEVQEAFLETP
jgi:hypothetical protein